MTISQVRPLDLVASLVCLTMAGSAVLSCTATGLRTVTPSNGARDISYRMASDSPAHRGITLDGGGFRGYEIIAGADGIVVSVDRNESRAGYHVRINHGLDSDQQPIYTDHYHVNPQLLVKAGDQVQRGQTIGFMGAHYHFIVLKEESPEKFIALDPKDYWFGIDLYKQELTSLRTGSFVIPCFDPNVSYQKVPIRFTYPAKCK